MAGKLPEQNLQLINPKVIKYMSEILIRKWIIRLTFRTIESLYENFSFYFLLFNVVVDSCPNGYTGSLCSKTCTFPNYGPGCQKRCLCPEQRCHFAKGCTNAEGYSGNSAKTQTCFQFSKSCLRSNLMVIFVTLENMNYTSKENYVRKWRFTWLVSFKVLP